MKLRIIMINQICNFILSFENLLWGYVGVPIVLLLGLALSIKSNFAQFRNLPAAVGIFASFFKKSDQKQKGIPPLKAFFACIGGSVGVGNVVGVCTAIQLGGPGALFWIWITAMAGAIVKYAEVYLGMRYRVSDDKGGYSGGPMYYLNEAFKRPWIPCIVCALLCLYGVEIFQFSVVAKSVSTNLDLNIYAVVGVLLSLVIFANFGGVRRVGSISSALIPIFVFLYVGMGTWVLINNIGQVPEVLGDVFRSAFTGHAAIGGFAGSSIMATMSQGIRRGCYTGDIGIGYASVIHSQTSVTVPEKQAALVIFEIFTDTFMICTTSVILVLVTGTWQNAVDSTLLVQSALGQYFPYMHFFMPLFLFLVGYATINAYFCVGLKCAEYLLPRAGKPLYYAYAIVVLIAFSFLDTTIAQAVMAIAGGFLLLINSVGIFMLRNHISYEIPKEQQAPAFGKASAAAALEG